MALSINPSWLIPALFLLVYLILKKRSHKRLPPGPAGLPLIGNLHQLGSLPQRSLHQLSKKYGPVLLVRLGTVPTVVVASPEAAEQVLKTHDLDCCSRPALAGTGRLSYNYLDVAFAPFDDYWRQVRKMCVLELFSTKRVQSFRYVREEEVASMISSISKSAISQSPVNLSNESLSLTASVIYRAAFGMSFQGIKLDKARLYDIADEANAVLGSFSAADFFPYIGWIVDRVTGLHARRERSFHDLDSLYEDAIRYHLENESPQGREDFLDVLLNIEKQQEGLGAYRLTRNHIKGILMNVLLAGIDTSALTMTWAMADLIRSPRVMKKVQAEIRSKIGNKGRVEEEDLESLEYLRMVIKETWRLHPPSTLLIARETMSEFKLDGYDVPQNTRIQVNVWAIGRDPNVWKDPEEFIPERFVDRPADIRNQNFEVLPFGSGRRGCPAIHMGSAIVELVLANLLYRFDWRLPEGMKVEDVSMEESSGLTARKKIPLELVPVDCMSNNPLNSEIL